jgi:RecJ-like exonuclease
MRGLFRMETTESVFQQETLRNPKRKKPMEEFGMVVSKSSGRGPSHGTGQCAECGGEVKVLVSPKRNPHSSKLGRAVSLKDHDLCRRCWRKVMHQQRHAGVLILPLSMFIGGRKLHPRLLMPCSASLPKEAS